MKFYKIEKLTAELSLHPCEWHNGMVFDAERDCEILTGTYTDFEEAKKVLAAHEGRAKYMDGGPVTYTDVTEYQISTWEGEEGSEEDEWEYVGDDYIGNLPYVKLYDDGNYYRGVPPVNCFIDYFDSLDDADRAVQDEDWQQKLTSGEHVLAFVNMDGEVIKRVVVDVE